MYQEYTVICIFDQMHVNLIWYLYPFMLNKICLSLSLSLRKQIPGFPGMYIGILSNVSSFQFICVLHFIPTYRVSMQELMM